MSTTNNTKSTSKATTLTQVQALIAGTEKHFPSGSFTLGNTAYTTATLTQAFQSLANTLVALNAAHASLKDAVTAAQTIDAKVGPLVRDFKRYVVSTFGAATQELADFGLPPPKARKPLTTEQRAAATAKLRATRAARGTTSRKQKLAVKGDVTGVVIKPVTSAATPPAAAQTAPSTSAPAPATPTK
ncbi:MAG: hypothetical protein WBY94_13365 [Polyangiaceae bacterium]